MPASNDNYRPFITAGARASMVTTCLASFNALDVRDLACYGKSTPPLGQFLKLMREESGHGFRILRNGDDFIIEDANGRGRGGFRMSASPNGRVNRSQRNRAQRLAMTQAEASQSIQRMQGLLVDLSQELSQFLRRQGWKSLGYPTAEDCLAERLGLGHDGGDGNQTTNLVRNDDYGEGLGERFTVFWVIRGPSRLDRFRRSS